MTKALEPGRSFRQPPWRALAGLALLAPFPTSTVAAPLRIAQDTPAVSSAPTLLPPAAQAAVPPPSAGTVAKKPDARGTPATVIDGQQVGSLLGKQVQSTAGEDMGHVADIIVDKSGAMRAAVIDFGGFLGVGSRKIAVDWSALHFPVDGKLDHVVVDIPSVELRVAPIYKEGEQVVVLGRPTDKAPPSEPARPAEGQAK